MNFYMLSAVVAVLIALPLDVYLIIKYGLAKQAFFTIIGNKNAVERMFNKQVKMALSRKTLGNDINKELRRCGFNPIVPYLTPAKVLFYRARLVIILGLIAGYFYGGKIAIAATGVFAVIVYEYGIIKLKSRKNAAEEQAEKLVKKMAILSSQYSNIAEMFCVMYPDFSGDLKKAMESCYIEFWVNGNQDEAMSHFQDYFFSPVITLAIDNAVACKADNRDLEMVSRLLLESLESYTEECSLRRAFVRGMKKMLTMALLLTIAVLVLCFFLLGGFANLGYILKVAKLGSIGVLAVCTYIYGMNLER